jgi:prefoldin subunit 5
MTGEEMERAIEFLLEGQAKLEHQLTETSKQLQTYAQTQSEFIQIVTQTMTRLADAQTRTDERLNKLIVVVEGHISDGHRHV